MEQETNAAPDPGSNRERALVDTALLAQILDSLTEPVLVVDTKHRVVYMNRAAAEHYTGGRTLMGTSLLDCHNENSRKVMIEVLDALREGAEERQISESDGMRIYMRAVRDESGELVGYYERYERPMKHPE
jgi:nitrogen-specific signal transduction histidine kinase